MSAPESDLATQLARLRDDVTALTQKVTDFSDYVDEDAAVIRRQIACAFVDRIVRTLSEAAVPVKTARALHYAYTRGTLSPGDEERYVMALRLAFPDRIMPSATCEMAAWLQAIATNTRVVSAWLQVIDEEARECATSDIFMDDPTDADIYAATNAETMGHEGYAVLLAGVMALTKVTRPSQALCYAHCATKSAPPPRV